VQPARGYGHVRRTIEGRIAFAREERREAKKTDDGTRGTGNGTAEVYPESFR
jgi:hypothetical protein